MKKGYQLLTIIFLLTVSVVITYHKSLSNNFVEWDDYTYVVDNDLVRRPDRTTIADVFSNYVSLNYHPLTILSLRLNNNDCKTCPGGISPVPFIRWNIIIHTLNTILVFLLIWILSRKRFFPAIFVAILFGVHPMHVESVAWISERKDLLYTFFFLAGLLTYLRYLNTTVGSLKKYLWLTAAFLLFVLSCLSKAMAVVFPLVLMLIRFWTAGEDNNISAKDAIKETLSLKNLVTLIPFFAVSLFFGILAISINHFNSFPFLHRIQYASYGFVMYMVKFIIPVNLATIYPYPSQIVDQGGPAAVFIKLAPFMFLLIACLVVYSIKKSRLYLFGMGFFLVSLIMVLQFVSVGYAIMADRYSYLAYVGLAFIPAMLIDKYLDRLRLVWYILSACFVVFMMYLSVKQTGVWKNGETLWAKTIGLYPALETPRSLRGIYFYKQAGMAKNEKDRTMFEEKAFEDFSAAIKAGSPRVDVYEDIGCIYGRRGDFTNALLYLDKAIGIRPEKGSAYFNRALTLSMINKNEEAINDYEKALKYSPERSKAIRNNRSNLFLTTGRMKEAIADLDYLISAEPMNFLNYYNRGTAKMVTDDRTGAVRDFQMALKLKPDDQQTLIQLQKILLK